MSPAPWLSATAITLAVLASCGEPGLDETARAAAKTYGVPAPLLLAMSHVDSRSVAQTFENGQYGWIRLTTWEGARHVRRAASLIGLTRLAVSDPQPLIFDRPRVGMYAAAALLRLAANRTGVSRDAPLDSWKPALEWFSGSPDPLANSLYGETVLKLATKSQAPTRRVGETRKPGHAGAAYTPFFAASPSTHRPLPAVPRPIKFIVIHTTQGAFSDMVGAFRHRKTQAAPHYIVRGLDGFAIQLIDERIVAFHDACFNEESIGIEHEGYVARGDVWYSDEMYRASATLVRDIAQRYGIPLDREHILGHGETPDCSDHADPGPLWDWKKYMSFVQTADATAR